MASSSNDKNIDINNNSKQEISEIMDQPSSIEEAAALLGTAITKASIPSNLMSSSSHQSELPKGMHSSFSNQPVRNSEIFLRLTFLRKLLESHQSMNKKLEEENSSASSSGSKKKKKKPEPLASAPSIIAVLMKLLVVSSVPKSSGSSSNISSGSSRNISPNTSAHGGASPNSKSNLSRTKSMTNIAGSSSTDQSTSTPPMLSNILRNLWSDCIVLCHVLGDGLTGPARIDIYAFLRNMIALANMNPKSSKAFGGNRLAALSVLTKMMKNPKLGNKISNWALEILQICMFGLRSGGAGDPSHRIACMHLACAVVTGSRNARIYMNSKHKKRNFIFVGALEDRALTEAIKVLKISTQDKFPEVREIAPELASLLSTVAVSSQPSGPSNSGGIGGGSMQGLGQKSSNSGASGPSVDPLMHLEDVIQACLKNLDDESANVSKLWSEALAKCICVAIDFGDDMREKSQQDDQNSGDRNPNSSSSENNNSKSSASAMSSGSGHGTRMKFGTKPNSNNISHLCSNGVSASIQYLVDAFVKVGGEFQASKCGGYFSKGGRSPKLSYANALLSLIQLQYAIKNIGSSDGMSVTNVIYSILKMVANEKKIPWNELPASNPGNKSTGASSILSNISVSKKNLVSPHDPYLSRIYTSEVLRRGLGEQASESAQLSMIRDLATFCEVQAQAQQQQQHITTTTNNNKHQLSNPFQLQVALIEMSHLVTTLGEAAMSSWNQIIPALDGCIIHPDAGVRYEACNLYAALTCAIPGEGVAMLTKCMEEIKSCHRSILEVPEKQQEAITEAQANAKKEASSNLGKKKTTNKLFRRGGNNTPEQSESEIQQSVQSEFIRKVSQLLNCLHGYSLAASMILLKLPLLSSGLPSSLLDDVVCTGESLVMTLYDETFSKKCPGPAVCCVRAGFHMISAAFTIGSHAVSNHIALVFHCWERVEKSMDEPLPYMSVSHQLAHIEPCVSSVVAFLRACPDFLLSVPYALNRVNTLLEKILGLVSRGGRFHDKPSKNMPDIACWERIKASVMEAFCWLPPGSFPIAAEKLYSFSAQIIQRCILETETPSSLIPSMIKSQDRLLDSSPLCRTTIGSGSGTMFTEVMGARVETHIAVLESQPVEYNERESAIFAQAWEELKEKKMYKSFPSTLDSSILDLTKISDTKNSTPPTPLHKIGTWVEPTKPSVSTKIRLIDFAIQSFACSFGLQDNKNKEKAARILEAIMSQSLQQTSQKSSSAFAVGLMGNENDKKSIPSKQEIACSTNITASLLACVRSLPYYEAFSDDKVSMGSPWMTKFKNLLFSLMPSTIPVVRRGAAECLASLAAVGLVENKHSVQSSILHSLDEVMQGHYPDGTARSSKHSSPDFLVSSRTGALLTLASIQRSIHLLVADSENRSQLKSHAIELSSISAPPTMIMMTRVLSCLSTGSFHEGDSSLARAYALHVFSLLMFYSIDDPALKDAESPEKIQIIKKAVELVEHNFLSTWTSSSGKREKFEAEPALLAVLVRFMTTLLPQLHLIQNSDPHVYSRFCIMVRQLTDIYSHPSVTLEALTFFEVLSNTPKKPNQLDILGGGVFDIAIPFVSEMLDPYSPGLLNPAGDIDSGIRISLDSEYCNVAAVISFRSLLNNYDALKFDSMQNLHLHVPLFQLLEMYSGRRQHSGCKTNASIATTCSSGSADQHLDVEKEIVFTIQTLLLLEKSLDTDSNHKRLLHWLLMSTTIASGNASRNKSFDPSSDNEITRNDVERYVKYLASLDAIDVNPHLSPSRWQVKAHAIELGYLAFAEIQKCCETNGKVDENSPHFNLVFARNYCSRLCREASNDISKTGSYIALHLQDLLSSACISSVATSENAELRSVQSGGIKLLVLLLQIFGDTVDPDVLGSKTLILQQYSSQTVSSVRHVIATNDTESDSTVNHQMHDELFLSGCEAAGLIFKKELVMDPIVFRRVIRPLIPPSKSNFTQVTHFPQTKDDVKSFVSYFSSSSQATSSQIYLLGSILTLSKLFTWASMGGLPESLMEPIFEEMKKHVNYIATYAGALALDAVRIIETNNAGSLLKSFDPSTGTSESKEDIPPVPNSDAFSIDAETPSSLPQGGLTYANLMDTGKLFQSTLEDSWVVLSVSSILQFMNNQDENNFGAITGWIEKLAPLLFLCLYKSMHSFEISSISYSNYLKAIENASMSVHGIKSIIKRGIPLSDSVKIEHFCEELGLILDEMFTKVILPFFEVNEGNDVRSVRNESLQPLINELFELVGALLNGTETVTVTGSMRIILTKFVLLPLHGYEKCKTLAGEYQSMSFKIVLSCLKSAQDLVVALSLSESDECSMIVKSLVQFCVTLLSSKDTDSKTIIHNEMEEATSALLLQCIGSVSEAEKKLFARESALTENWTAWKIICISNTNGGDSLFETLLSTADVVRDCLSDTENVSRHSAALSGIRSAAQENPMIVPYLMQSLGAYIIQLLRMHGLYQCKNVESQSQRTSVFADGIRLLLLSLQQLIAAASTSDEAQTQLSSFLQLMFKIMVEVIEYNGLPNNPKPQNIESDVALGRTCAQAIVHVAKSSPASFKMSISTMELNDRSVLESSVRAEMSGYGGATGVAPVKKKLSLKGFTRV